MVQQEEPGDVLSMVPLPSLLDSLRMHYSTTASAGLSAVGHAISSGEVAELRQRLIKVVSHLLSWQAGGKASEDLCSSLEDVQVRLNESALRRKSVVLYDQCICPALLPAHKPLLADPNRWVAAVQHK